MVQKSDVYEGGEDAALVDDEPPKKKSRMEMKADKYADKMEEFSVKNSGCTDDSPLVRDRGCTDILCLFVMLLFMGAMLGCTIFGIQNGDVTKMMAPYDYQGRFCGIGDLKEYDNLYFTVLAAPSDPVKTLFQNAVCV